MMISRHLSLDEEEDYLIDHKITSPRYSAPQPRVNAFSSLSPVRPVPYSLTPSHSSPSMPTIPLPPHRFPVGRQRSPGRPLSSPVFRTYEEGARDKKLRILRQEDEDEVLNESDFRSKENFGNSDTMENEVDYEIELCGIHITNGDKSSVQYFRSESVGYTNKKSAHSYSLSSPSVSSSLPASSSLSSPPIPYATSPYFPQSPIGHYSSQPNNLFTQSSDSKLPESHISIYGKPLIHKTPSTPILRTTIPLTPTNAIFANSSNFSTPNTQNTGIQSPGQSNFSVNAIQSPHSNPEIFVPIPFFLPDCPPVPEDKTLNDSFKIF